MLNILKSSTNRETKVEIHIGYYAILCNTFYLHNEILFHKLKSKSKIIIYNLCYHFIMYNTIMYSIN